MVSEDTESKMKGCMFRGGYNVHLDVSRPGHSECGETNRRPAISGSHARVLPNTHKQRSLIPEAMAPFDLDACIQQLLRKQLLHEALLREICEKTKEVLMKESNVVHVSAPVTVVGDIHG